MARDNLRVEITKQLAPVLERVGFVRVQPKHFMSVSGDIVRHLGFQLSQWGGKSFYIHLYANTLLNPLGELHGYRVGRRLQGEPNSGAVWEGATEDSASAGIASAVRVLESGQLSWLISVSGLRDFVFEYIANPETSADDFDLAVCFARAGETNRAWWSAEKIVRSPVDPDAGDYSRDLRQRAKELQRAIDGGQTSKLLESWRSEYIARNKLSALAS